MKINLIAISLNPLRLMHVLVKEFWTRQSGLRTFAQASLTGPTCTVQEDQHGPLWPVPPVRWRWTASSKLSPRRRKRRRAHALRSELLNLILVSFNWMVLGFPKQPPNHARIGASISVQQHECIERLELMLRHHLDMGPFEGSDLGRASGKFVGILHALEELPRSDLRVEDLFECLSNLHSSFDPYKSYFKPVRSEPNLNPPEHNPHRTCERDMDGRTATVPICSAKAVTSSRVKWEYPPSFHAAEFLGPVVKEAFLDPEVLRLPADQWPPSKPAKMHVS